jgi:ketosteroid isomerase-like protein
MSFGWRGAGYREHEVSDRNVQVVRAAFEAWEGAGMDSILQFLAPEIEWKVRTDLPDAQLYRGHEGIRELMSHFDEVMEDMWFQAQELIPVGEDRVLAQLSWGGRGKGSGVDFDERREAWVFSLRAGQISRVEEFATREQALTAVGHLGAAQTSRPA